jgi:hypothetical protein
MLVDWARFPAPTIPTTSNPNSAASWRGAACCFYAVTQAVLTIFCFRWRDLLVDADVDDEVGVAFKGFGSSNVSGFNMSGNNK